jgi:CHAT domain-containing protein
MTNFVQALACAFALSAFSNLASAADVAGLDADADGFLRRGDTDAAIRSLNQAADQLGSIPVKTESIPLLRGVADKFRSLGARSSAVPILQRGIAIAEVVDPESVTSLLSELGNTQGEIEDHAAAKATFERLLSKVPPRNMLGRAAVYISLLKAEVRGNDNEAEILRMINGFSSAASNISPESSCDLLIQFVGTVLKSESAKNHIPALNSYLDTSLGIARSNGDRINESYALGFKGGVAEINDQLPRALKLTRDALLVSLQAGLPGHIYRWQWQVGRLQAKAGNRTEAIATYREAVVSLGKVQSELLKGSYIVFRERVLPVYNELIDLLLIEAAAETSAVRRQTLLVSVQQTVEQFNKSEVLDYFDDDCLLPQETTQLDSIAADVAVIYPIVMADRLVVVAKLADGIHQYVHQIGEGKLKQLVLDFRESVEDYDSDKELYQDLGGELYDLIIRPMETSLASFNVTRLLFVPSSMFRTIPMAALYDGNEFLIENYDIVTTLGLELTDPRPFGEAVGTPMLGGISESVQGFSALPGVATELKAIQQTFGGDIMLDRDFSVESVAEELGLGSYSMVHLATHGVFVREASNSYLLGYDQKLTLDRLQDSVGNRRFLGNPLDLLVLSACETAAGDDRAALGLAGVSLKAGARTTVASLWPISDEATSRLMTDFYGELKAGTGKAAALRAAQLNLVNDPVFNHPNFWSAFLLIGNGL